jgi:hypothetical protein
MMNTRRRLPSAETERTITQVTRREIFDYLSVSANWAGALQEHEFLSRLYDLDKMPSTDYRSEFNTAAKDIWKHRVVNSDWSDDWVFTDSRFNLLHSEDEVFLRFLCETLHPIVRPRTAEAEALSDVYKEYLRVDGWEIYVTKELSRKPVYGFRRILDGGAGHLRQAKAVAETLTGAHLHQQIRRMEESIDKDPDLAIGTAKEFVETLCKTILTERGVPFSTSEDLPALLKQTARALTIVPDALVQHPTAATTITVLLNSLGSVGHRLAELRNAFGTGHGKDHQHLGLERHHAGLAVGAAATLGVFLFECHKTGRS